MELQRLLLVILTDKEHQIIEIVSSNAFKIDVGSNASSVATGLAKSSGSVTLTFQINTGLDATVGGTGWGAWSMEWHD